MKDELSTSRARVLINRADPETGERKDHLPNDPPPKTPVVRERTQAFTLRKNLYDVTDDNDGEIAIVSQDLWDLLGQILKYYPNHLFTGPLMTLTSPYEALILNWEKLEEAAEKDSTNEKDRQARSDLRLLLDAIAAGSGDPKLDKFFKTRQSNREQKVVSFESLWTLFPRGTLVYGRPFLGQDQMFLVYDNLSPWPRRAGRPWALICWAYDWDGKSFKRLPLRLEFEHFDAPKPITTLPYYPLEFHEKPEEIKERLIARGEKYREYCTAKQGSRMFDYSGEAIFAKRGFSRLDDGTVSPSPPESNTY